MRQRLSSLLPAARALILLGATAGLTVAPPLAAQGAPLRGTVIDSTTGRPVPDALIRVNGTNTVAHTDLRGVFSLAGLTGQTVTMTVTRIGYRPRTVSVAANTATVTIRLAAAPLKLDEVVVTGQAGDTRRRALGNDVAVVDLAGEQRITPSKSVQEALSVAVPGLQVQRASGQLGAGGVTRIRGVSSLSLSPEPIIFIDGVRADNQSGSQSIAFNGGGDRPSRINDIDPNDIESIQVLKGPSAATLYGTEASNGIILITTKRGVAGSPVWTAELRAGANWLPSPDKLYSGIYYRDPSGAVQHLNLIDNDIARGFGSPFATGKPYGGTLSIRGGSETIGYYFSGSYDRDEGIVSYNWENKLNGTANLTFNAGEEFTADLSLGYTRSKTRAASANQPMTTYLVWACPNNACVTGSGDAPDEAGRGYLAAVTPEAFKDIQGLDNIDRSRLGLTLTHRPTSWLTQRFVIGGDFSNDESSLYYPRGSNPGLGFPLGVKAVQSDRASYVSTDYSLTAKATITRKLTSETSAGTQYYYKKYEEFGAQGNNFPIRGVNSVSGGGIRTGFDSPIFNFENKTLGLYVQEQLGWSNSLFLTGAVRGDDNSAFGTNYDFVLYPKVSIAWVVSDAPFFRASSLLSTLKLRAAWGAAGEQPNAFAAAQTYGPSVGSGGTPTVTPLNYGNPNLTPEVSREFEGGFDASLFNDRVTLSATYYNKVTRDGIVSAPVSPSSGFPGSRFLNVGRFSNRGFEFAVDGSPIVREGLRVHLRGTLATNRNRLDVLGADTPLPNTNVGQLTGEYNVAGFPLGSFFLPHVVSATLTAPGQVTDVMCEGGTNFSRGDGTVVPCDGAPLLYSGHPVPSWLSSFGVDVTWGRWTLGSVAEFEGGNWYEDGSVGGSHIFFNNSRAAVEQTDPILVAYQHMGAFAAAGLMKAGFGKLRNVSLSYSAPERVALALGASSASLTLTAANILTIWRAQQGTFGAKAIDPEIRTNTAQAFSYIVDPNLTGGFTQESWPQFRRFQATIRLAF